MHVAIGNSDGRLTQLEWSRFHGETNRILGAFASQFFGRWVSPSTSEYQNACWALELKPEYSPDSLKTALARLAKKWQQDSIAYNESETDFVTPERLVRARR